MEKDTKQSISEFIKIKLITILIAILIMNYQTFIKLMGIQIRRLPSPI